jgi:type IV pilus assembly protein PilE
VFPAQRSPSGFTLIELMVVVAVIAIITAVAYPSYTEHLVKAKRAEGKTALLKAMQLEERAYTSNGTYQTNLVPLFGANAAPVRSGENPAEGNYDLTAEADPDLQQGVKITATPRTGVFSDPDCGVLTLNSVGQRTFASTNGKGTKDRCW